MDMREWAKTAMERRMASVLTEREKWAWRREETQSLSDEDWGGLTGVENTEVPRHGAM